MKIIKLFTDKIIELFDRRVDGDFDITLLPFGFGIVRPSLGADLWHYNIVLHMKSVSPHEWTFLVKHIYGPLWFINKEQLSSWRKIRLSDYELSQRAKIKALRQEASDWEKAFDGLNAEVDKAKETIRSMRDCIAASNEASAGMYVVSSLLLPEVEITNQWKPTKEDACKIVSEIKRLKALDKK